MLLMLNTNTIYLTIHRHVSVIKKSLKLKNSDEIRTGLKEIVREHCDLRIRKKWSNIAKI